MLEDMDFGGGFFADTSNSKPQEKHTTTGSGGGSGQKPSTCTPLTIKQLISCRKQNEQYFVDGKELFAIEIVGQVLKKENKQNFTLIKIDDCTGQFDVKLFPTNLSSDYLKQILNDMKEGNIYKFFGHINEWKDRLSLVSYNLRPITDMNEFYFHHLESIQVHLINTRGIITPTQPQTSTYNNKSVDRNQQQQHYSNDDSVMVNVVQQVDEGLLEEMMKVAHQLTSSTNRRGCTKDDIFEPFGNYDRDYLENAFSQLVNEAKLFNTIDGDHWMPNSY
ncbi:hypothetical protein ABK040_015206 [Willaertia magna]